MPASSSQHMLGNLKLKKKTKTKNVPSRQTDPQATLALGHLSWAQGAWQKLLGSCWEPIDGLMPHHVESRKRKQHTTIDNQLTSSSSCKKRVPKLIQSNPRQIQLATAKGCHFMLLSLHVFGLPSPTMGGRTGCFGHRVLDPGSYFTDFSKGGNLWSKPEPLEVSILTNIVIFQLYSQSTAEQISQGPICLLSLPFFRRQCYEWEMASKGSSWIRKPIKWFWRKQIL